MDSQLLLGAPDRRKRERVPHTVDGRAAHALPTARNFRMFSAWPFQPLEFMLNALARRDSGMASNPDSTIVRRVPPGASSSVNVTSVVARLSTVRLNDTHPAVPAQLAR
ncbi:MAG: hypothetical protein ACRENH_08775 [Gemmatimonadaceae bacterium]